MFIPQKKEIICEEKVVIYVVQFVKKGFFKKE